MNNLWSKNILLVVFSLAGASLIGYYLSESEQLKQPESFHPTGSLQKEIKEVAANIDDSLRQQWRDDRVDLPATDRASDLEIARRLSLGLAGTIPSVQEIRLFEQKDPADRIHWWISRLLEDRRTSNYLAERFARAFVGVDDGPFIVFRRRRFVSWLSDQIHDNVPYNELVRTLLTEEGLWTDHPAVNFYTKTINDETARPDPILLAARTSRAFLGMRIDCLQCHDDFLGTINLGSAVEPTGGMQTDFHSLASFFSQVDNSLLGIRDNAQREAYRYQLLDEDEESVIEPKVPFNSQLVDATKNPRLRLANWITHPENKPFARAIVNRIWAIMHGRGLIKTVDDISLEGPFPAPMEALADDFIEHDFDLHRLIRIIAETDIFQRASLANFEITDEHEDNWTVFPMARLRPEQVARSIIQSSSLITIDSTAHVITRLTQFGQQADFVRRFGDPGEDEFVDRGETVTQRLLMLNGNMVKERIDNPLNSPAHLAGLSPNDAKAVETIFLSTLTRRPSDTESEYFVNQLAGLSGNAKSRKIQDIYWTLTNSIEFNWNH